MKVSDLQPKCKIKSKLGAEAIVDRVFDDGIFLSAWNQPLSKPDRLFLTMKEVEKQIDILGRTLLDGKIRITKEELQTLVQRKIGNYVIEEFIDKGNLKDDSLIIQKKLVKGDVLYIKEGVKFEFQGYVDGLTLLSLEIGDSKKITNILVEDETLKEYSFNNNSKNMIKLEEVVSRLFGETIDRLILLD